MKGLLKAAPIALAALVVSGCLKTDSTAEHSQYSDRDNSPPILSDYENGSQNNDTSETNTETGLYSSVRIEFDPERQVIPYPNNLMFEAGARSAADLDGTLNVPGADGTDSTANIARALSDLDGFSTVESWRLGFTGTVNANSLKIGETVRVFELEEVAEDYPKRIQSQNVERELTADDIQINYEENAVSNNAVMYLSPKKPLKYNRTYSVIITNGIKDKAGSLVNAPLAAAVSRGTSKLGLDAQGRPTRCHKFFGAQEFDSPEQERSITLLQCMTFYGYDPVIRDSKIGLSKDDIVLNWAITTQRKDEPFERLLNSFLSGSALAGNSPVVSGVTCTQPLCFLDVGSLLGKTAPKTPGNKATVFPGSIRLPIMAANMKEVLDSTNTNYFLGNSSARFSRTNAEKLIQSTWSCNGASCNTDAARNQKLTPKIEDWVTHPIVLALPDSCTKTNKCPLVIFQHAIQQDRSNALAFADTLADQGFAVVGIDMPLHGMEKRFLNMSNAKDQSRAQLYAPDLNDQLYNSTLSAARNIIPLMVEGTFYLDLVSDNAEVNDDGSTKSDNLIDPSGAHFLNPSLPLAQRDILRQASVNLAALSYYLYQSKYQQCGMNLLSKSCSVGSKKLSELIDFKNLHFVGHSVGNIVATPFLAANKNIRTITMLAPAGVLLRTLEGSEVIGQKLSEGLSAKGVVKGTENYYRFFASVQAAIDPAEPFNHLAGLKTRKNPSTDELEARPMYIAAIKGSSTNSQDKVLPWTIAGSAMAGSEHLVRLLNVPTSASMITRQQIETNEGLITLVNKDSSNQAQTLQAAVLLNRGDHASFLLPKNEVFAKAKKEAEDIAKYKENHIIPSSENSIFIGEDTHAEMQRQVGSFLKEQGLMIRDISSDFLSL